MSDHEERSEDRCSGAVLPAAARPPPTRRSARGRRRQDPRSRDADAAQAPAARGPAGRDPADARRPVARSSPRPGCSPGSSRSAPSPIARSTVPAARSGCASTHRAASGCRRPALVYVHGGSFMHGDLDSHDAHLPHARRGRARAGDRGRLPACAGGSVPGRRRRRLGRVDLGQRQRRRASVSIHVASPSAATAPAATSPPSRRCEQRVKATRRRRSSCSSIPAPSSGSRPRAARRTARASTCRRG